jgi:quercetin dioxygenase-like cupin family protein
VTLRAGQLIVMPADIPHALKALQKTKMLLTMMKP